MPLSAVAAWRRSSERGAGNWQPELLVIPGGGNNMERLTMCSHFSAPTWWCLMRSPFHGVDDPSTALAHAKSPLHGGAEAFIWIGLDIKFQCASTFQHRRSATGKRASFVIALTHHPVAFQDLVSEPSREPGHLKNKNIRTCATESRFRRCLAGAGGGLHVPSQPPLSRPQLWGRRC